MMNVIVSVALRPWYKRGDIQASYHVLERWRMRLFIKPRWLDLVRLCASASAVTLSMELTLSTVSRYSLMIQTPKVWLCHFLCCGFKIRWRFNKLLQKGNNSPPSADHSLIFARWRPYMPPSNTCFHGPAWVPTNGISVGSAIFSGLMVMTNANKHCEQ